MEYKPLPGEELKSPGKWGYIQLLMDSDFAEWMNETVRYCDWLLLDMSQLWDDKAWKLPGVTEDERFVLTFAWDSSSWPWSVEDIYQLIKDYHKQQLDKQITSRERM